MNGWYETHTWGYRVVAHIDIVQHRLHSQHLLGPKFATPAAVVAHFGAVQAQDYLPALWALGLRNPWRYSFDRVTGDLWIADVGQNQIEEINVVRIGSAGGLNFGWPVMEGAACFQRAGCDQAGLAD